MRVSEMIEALQAFQEAYGDTKVFIDLKDAPHASEQIHFGYLQDDEGNGEIRIADYPY